MYLCTLSDKTKPHAPSFYNFTLPFFLYALLPSLCIFCSLNSKFNFHFYTFSHSFTALIITAFPMSKAFSSSAPASTPPTIKPDHYSHSPVHYAVVLGDHTTLSRLVSTLPRLSDPRSMLSQIHLLRRDLPIRSLSFWTAEMFPIMKLLFISSFNSMTYLLLVLLLLLALTSHFKVLLAGILSRKLYVVGALKLL